MRPNWRERRVGDKSGKTQGTNHAQWDWEPLANFFYKGPHSKYFQPNSLFQLFSSAFVGDKVPQTNRRYPPNGRRDTWSVAIVGRPCVRGFQRDKICSAQLWESHWDSRSESGIFCSKTRRGGCVHWVTLTLWSKGSCYYIYQRVPQTINIRGKEVTRSKGTKVDNYSMLLCLVIIFLIYKE